jgi:hypothetical protein
MSSFVDGGSPFGSERGNRALQCSLGPMNHGVEHPYSAMSPLRLSVGWAKMSYAYAVPSEEVLALVTPFILRQRRCSVTSFDWILAAQQDLAGWQHRCWQGHDQLVDGQDDTNGVIIVKAATLIS